MSSESKFSMRHCGLSDRDTQDLLKHVGLPSVEALMEAVIPESIFDADLISSLPEAMTEMEYLEHIQHVLKKNNISNCFIGQGYYGTHVPSVLRRNILENPGWYTAYTPYQAEIAQGRLEALFNFQTVVSELTGMALANASLLDEGTAAAEAVLMMHAVKNRKNSGERNTLFIDEYVFNQTINVVKTKAEALGIEVTIGNWKTAELDSSIFAVLLQYPDAQGSVHDYSFFAEKATRLDIGIVVCADLLSLTLYQPPGSWGADVVVGTTQRLGVPMWYGGPHAGYFATKEDYKRHLPGRIIGLSKDRYEKPAFRMALQTREQHIKREKATSNICTAQALLAILAGMYAVYHGAEGLKRIALKIRGLTSRVALELEMAGYEILTSNHFDTLSVHVDNAKMKSIKNRAEEGNIQLYIEDNEIRFSFDECKSEEAVSQILFLFGLDVTDVADNQYENTVSEEMSRKEPFMLQEIFRLHRTETQMMRYIKSLENKDFSLVHGMIPLGSCTMKLNAATQLLPLSLPEAAELHPMSEDHHAEGYREVIQSLGEYLSLITGLEKCTFQPNSGAQGEYAGLLAIKKYHEAQEQNHRDLVLIPASAHGTNPASATVAGLRVLVVATDERGNIDMDDLRTKAYEHKEELCAIMITYPSTHGVYETEVTEVCQIVHSHGGLVYMDGANMNAQVGYTSPGTIGADVCHLNLHKTFAIPHGGGGPGMGPICVNKKLSPFLPVQRYDTMIDPDQWAVASSRFGSPSILLISYGYIRLLGAEGLKKATAQAILNANYLESRLRDYYPVLYKGPKGRVAHEFIIDLRDFKAYGIQAEDVAKRLMDYGFHAPTLSFPVPGTLMIEPTESEDVRELDRFCEAMICIRAEIQEVIDGAYTEDNNPLVNAPHTLQMVCSTEWAFPYPREKAAFPIPGLMSSKFWPAVARIDNAFGDRNLICVCPPIEAYS